MKPAPPWHFPQDPPPPPKMQLPLHAPPTSKSQEPSTQTKSAQTPPVKVQAAVPKPPVAPPVAKPPVPKPPVAKPPVPKPPVQSHQCHEWSCHRSKCRNSRRYRRWYRRLANSRPWESCHRPLRFVHLALQLHRNLARASMGLEDWVRTASGTRHSTLRSELGQRRWRNFTQLGPSRLKGSAIIERRSMCRCMPHA